jgi:ubiquinone/menaquinone biosynthesis C-methylase UbiE
MNRNRADVLAENARLSHMEAPVYDQNHFEIFHPWEQQRLRRHLGRYDGLHRVLDVGAGTGNVVTKVRAPVRVAVDLSPEMLQRSRPKDPGVRLVVALAEDLPFRDASFDLVVTYSTLHHLADWSALAEMRRATCVGGGVLLDHEEAFQVRGWRGLLYDVLCGGLRAAAFAWYWHRSVGRLHLAYRRGYWPYSNEVLRAIDFRLTDGGHPDPATIEAELARLGMSTRRHHYLLSPLPMVSRWQHLVDRLCVRLQLGHFSVEATR